MKNWNKVSAYILFSIIAILIMFVPNISAKSNTTNYEWIAKYIESNKHIFEPNGHIVALVNGQPILSSELNRRCVNMKILMEMQVCILKETSLNHIDNITLENLIEMYKSEYEKQGSEENQLKELIIEEVLFQESCKSVSVVDYDEAYKFEKELFSLMTKKERAPLEKYAKGLELTSEEYIQKYLVPLRQRKLTIGLYLDSLFVNEEPLYTVDQVDKALEELIETLLIDTTIKYNP